MNFKSGVQVPSQKCFLYLFFLIFVCFFSTTKKFFIASHHRKRIPQVVVCFKIKAIEASLIWNKGFRHAVINLIRGCKTNRIYLIWHGIINTYSSLFSDNATNQDDNIFIISSALITTLLAKWITNLSSYLEFVLPRSKFEDFLWRELMKHKSRFVYL